MIAPPSLADCIPTTLATASALHPGFYSGEEWLQFERRQIFAKSWQLAGPASEVAGSGDHAAIDVAGFAVLLVRGEDGILRAFHNVCSHRGGPVASCAGKGAKRLRCAYHGWTFELDGRLRAAPEMQDAADFNPFDHGLREVALREWQGLVFVALSADTPDFDKVYGGVAERIAPIDLSRMRFSRREIWPVACNWKVYVDNYLEEYHVPAVHPALNDIVDYKGYSTELGDWRSVQTSTLAPSDAYGSRGRVFYWHVFPNVMLNVVPGRIQTNRVIPDGAGRCLVEFDYYYADDDARSRADADRAFSAKVQEEDRVICEAVQKNLASGAYSPGRLCPKREEGVWHFQNLLRNAYSTAFAKG